MKSINVSLNKKETSPNLLKVKKVNNNNVLLFNLVILTKRANYIENKKEIIFIGHGFKKIKNDYHS